MENGSRTAHGRLATEAHTITRAAIIFSFLCGFFTRRHVAYVTGSSVDRVAYPSWGTTPRNFQGRGSCTAPCQIVWEDVAIVDTLLNYYNNVGCELTYLRSILIFANCVTHRWYVYSIFRKSKPNIKGYCCPGFSLLKYIGYVKNGVLLAPQSQGASFTATNSVKNMVYRCIYQLVPDANQRGRDGVGE